LLGLIQLPSTGSSPILIAVLGTKNVDVGITERGPIMPSPFPGMNPYLEQDYVWHDFHERFIPLCSEMLVPQVRPGYIVRLDEHIYIHELPAEERRFLGRADIGVTRLGPSAPRADTKIISPPARGTLVPTVDVVRHAFIEIRDRRNRGLVTVVGLLSPANKRPGYEDYIYPDEPQPPLSSADQAWASNLMHGDSET
jgi:hypothetical protein